MRAWVLLLLLPAGCGPSIQSLWEGEVRFEHCYRLDHDDQISASHRRACWGNWLSVYSYGQSRDRIEYAQTRLQSLELGDGRTLGLDGGGASDDSAGAPGRAALSPQDPSRSPPATSRAATKPADPATPEAPPASPCITDCSRAWHDCELGCPPAELAATDPDCSKRCGEDYKACVKRCLQ